MSKTTLPELDLTEEDLKEPTLKSPDIDQQVEDILKITNGLSKKTSDEIERTIKIDPNTAKDAFEKIQSVTEEEGNSEDKQKKISEIQKTSEDSFLQLFANITQRALSSGMDEKEEKDFFDQMKMIFSFLGQDEERDMEGDLQNFLSGWRKNPRYSDLIKSAFDETFSQATSLTAEDQRTADQPLSKKEKNSSDQQQTEDAIKSSAIIFGRFATSLTLALTVPPPLGVLAGLGLMYATRNLGAKKKSNQEEQDPQVREIGEALHKRIINPALANGPQTNIGIAAEEVSEREDSDLEEVKNSLKQTKTSLQSGKMEKEQESEQDDVGLAEEEKEQGQERDDDSLFGDDEEEEERDDLESDFDEKDERDDFSSESNEEEEERSESDEEEMEYDFEKEVKTVSGKISRGVVNFSDVDGDEEGQNSELPSSSKFLGLFSR